MRKREAIMDKNERDAAWFLGVLVARSMISIGAMVWLAFSLIAAFCQLNEN
jgi:hypothetical protein